MRGLGNSGALLRPPQAQPRAGLIMLLKAQVLVMPRAFTCRWPLGAMGGAWCRGRAVPVGHARALAITCLDNRYRIAAARWHSAVYHYSLSTITDICFRARVTQPSRVLVHFFPSSSHPQCENSLRGKPGSYTKQLAIINKYIQPRTIALSAILHFYSAVGASGNSLQVGLNAPRPIAQSAAFERILATGGISKQKQGCVHILCGG